MGRTAVETLLLALEHAWEHPWEALVGTLDGVDEAEATWSAPPYDDVESAGQSPKPGSIHWHVNHLAGCKLYYIARLAHTLDPGQPLREDDRLDPEPTYAAEFARLEKIRREEFDQIAGLDDDDLARTTSSGKSVLEFLVATTRHDTWHAGQIAMARRLYRRRKDTTSS